MPKVTKRSKKSLLEQIADISDPKPKDFDIENADLNDAANDRGSDSESESEDEELRREHYIEMGKSSLRQQQGIGNLGPKYTGSRTSRKALYGSDEDASEEEAESDEGSESISGDSEEDIASRVSQTREEDSEVGSDESDADESDDGMGFNDDAGAEAAQEQDRVREDIRKLEEGERALLQSITQTAKSDVEKGHHVLNQTRLWEGALDARIRVQKIVTAADELPSFDQFGSLVESRFSTDDDEDEMNELEKARQSMVLLISSLVELRRALAEQHPAAKKTMAGQKRKSEDDDEGEDGDVEAMWKELEEVRSGFQPFRDESLEKWGSKVQISAGVTSSKKFKAVNQGIMHQISQALASEERLVERTQLKRTEYKIIGQSDTSEKPAAVADAHLKDRNPEIFDDTDFYQQLLRELIESRMVDSNDPTASLGVQWAAVKQQSKSKKRNVDTKASKGRKVRYHVIEKLQNFMPPIPAGSWHEDMVNELFSSLLGQR
ncbi:rRNA-processing protein bfr2, partial [Linderina pennispora]